MWPLFHLYLYAFIEYPSHSKLLASKNGMLSLPQFPTLPSTYLSLPHPCSCLFPAPPCSPASAPPFGQLPTCPPESFVFVNQRLS